MGFFNSLFGSESKAGHQAELKVICHIYVQNQKELTDKAGKLFKKRKRYVEDIIVIEELLSSISHLPSWCKDEMKESLNQLEDFRKAVEYENSPQKFAEITDSTGRTAAYIAGAGTAAGAAIAALGPTAAMSIATVIGTASTGTAISALSGAAATNAALAWLGGGVAAAGGTGMAGGSLVLGLFGPVGLAIAGLGTTSGLIYARIKNKKQIKKIQEQIDVIKQENKVMELKLQHLSELIKRSERNEREKLDEAVIWISAVQPRNFKEWTEKQKHELENLINIVSNTVQLINERI